MSDPVITVENLGKRYVLAHAPRSDTLRDTLTHGARGLLRRFTGGADPSSEEFWALRDVGFTVNRGEVVGIIGRNGAGKSTLLKILSRITEPTTGRVTLRGRVASLLEVGTGFHPELSGRENIFLNGAILGMSRAEIRQKFDEIVAFAEVERFLDTPVKHYSSGMYVRLAFAVAAHLEPEILIVDEVLAVGDAAFQKKCLGKMQSVAAGEGRTVLFVSHNMAAVRELTRQCLYLQQGRLRLAGRTPEIIDRYTRDTDSPTAAGKGTHATVIRAALVDAAGLEIPVISGREPLALDVTVESDGHPTSSVECYLTDTSGVKIAIGSPCKFHDWYLPAQPGRYRVRLGLALPAMASGPYLIDVCTVTKERGFDHYLAGAVVCAVAPGSYRPGGWDLRSDYQAGYFILDAGPPTMLSSPSSIP
jgi:lipopolysaccharide transport system ATP-binding protein